jgi:hypothetical protein
MYPYEVDIINSQSSASSQAAKDANAIPASLTIFGDFEELFKHFSRLFR